MRNYLTGKERLLVALLAFILPFSFAKAEVREDGKTRQQGWYIGVEGGMPFGFSTFSSFGHDKTRLGWAAGLYGGYRFNSIFSAELSAKEAEKRRPIRRPTTSSLPAAHRPSMPFAAPSYLLWRSSILNLFYQPLSAPDRLKPLDIHF